MTNPEQTIADAIREVTGKVLNAVKDGYRSRAVDAEDIVEILLAIADRLDPTDGSGAEPRPSILDAARALLEARENQIVTQVEWDQLREAVAAAERRGYPRPDHADHEPAEPGARHPGRLADAAAGGDWQGPGDRAGAAADLCGGGVEGAAEAVAKPVVIPFAPQSSS